MCGCIMPFLKVKIWLRSHSWIEWLLCQSLMALTFELGVELIACALAAVADHIHHAYARRGCAVQSDDSDCSR